MLGWVTIAVRRDVVLRSVRVALVVGTVLVVINYFDRFLNGGLVLLDYWKVALTYCVPYCVSTYASVGAIRGEHRGG